MLCASTGFTLEGAIRDKVVILSRHGRRRGLAQPRPPFLSFATGLGARYDTSGVIRSEAKDPLRVSVTARAHTKRAFASLRMRSVS